MIIVENGVFGTELRENIQGQLRLRLTGSLVCEGSGGQGHWKRGGQ